MRKGECTEASHGEHMQAEQSLRKLCAQCYTVLVQRQNAQVENRSGYSEVLSACLLTVGSLLWSTGAGRLPLFPTNYSRSSGIYCGLVCYPASQRTRCIGRNCCSIFTSFHDVIARPFPLSIQNPVQPRLNVGQRPTAFLTAQIVRPFLCQATSFAAILQHLHVLLPRTSAKILDKRSHRSAKSANRPRMWCHRRDAPQHALPNGPL